MYRYCKKKHVPISRRHKIEINELACFVAFLDGVQVSRGLSCTTLLSINLTIETSFWLASGLILQYTSTGSWLSWRVFEGAFLFGVFPLLSEQRKNLNGSESPPVTRTVMQPPKSLSGEGNGNAVQANENVRGPQTAALIGTVEPSRRRHWVRKKCLT